MFTYDFMHVALYSLVGTNQHYGVIYCLHLHNHPKFNSPIQRVFPKHLYPPNTQHIFTIWQKCDHNMKQLHQDENIKSKVCMNNAPVFDSYKGGNKL